MSTNGNSRHQKMSLSKVLKNYLLRHMQTFFYTMGQLSNRPVSTFMTTMVIGIALSLPAGLNVLLNNVNDLLNSWGDASQISLFLRENTTEKRAMELQRKFQRDPQVESALYISPKEALNEFKTYSGFGDALSALQDNPLPGVLVVTPELNHRDHQSVSNLLNDLSMHQEVDMAQIDMEWIKRINAMMEIGERAVWILAALLSVAVLLVIGNTIRLAIQNRKDEIIITKLIGATDAFIQRPFLYTGFWYGLIGSVIAVILIEISLFIISSPVERLTNLYQSDFSIAGMSLTAIFTVLVSGSMLGLSGSWIAVNRHLKEIEPS